jgi:hypothetical protein
VTDAKKGAPEGSTSMARRWAIGAVALCVTLLLAVPAYAHESSRRFRDPSGDGEADVRTTAKATIHKAPHHHRIRFNVRIFGPDYHVWVFVDSRGDPRADFKLVAFEDLGLDGCRGKRVGGERIPLRCGLRRPVENNPSLWQPWWSIRRSVLDPTKRIRWRVVSKYPGDLFPDIPEVDRAPDDGWYM